MREEAIRAITQESVRKKFRDHEVIKGKGALHYPDSVQREYIHLTREYMNLVRQTVAAHLPEIQQILKENRQDEAETMRLDGFLNGIRSIFRKIREEISQKLEQFDLENRVEKVAGQNQRYTAREWKNIVRRTLDVEIPEEYYRGTFSRETLQNWTRQNVSQIQSIPSETLDKMEEIILSGFQSGKPLQDVAKEIQEAYGVSQRKAGFLTRDQIAKLNAELIKSQQMDAGVEEYIWSTSGDHKVRDKHRELGLSRQRFRWDDPPIVSEKGKPVRRCHPGEDYNCRCVARPCFNINTLSLPIAPDRDSTSGKIK